MIWNFFKLFIYISTVYNHSFSPDSVLCSIFYNINAILHALLSKTICLVPFLITCSVRPNQKTRQHHSRSDLLRTLTSWLIGVKESLKRLSGTFLIESVWNLTFCEIPDTPLLIMNAKRSDFDLSSPPKLSSSLHSSCNASSSRAPHDARF